MKLTKKTLTTLILKEIKKQTKKSLVVTESIRDKVLIENTISKIKNSKLTYLKKKKYINAITENIGNAKKVSKYLTEGIDKKLLTLQKYLTKEYGKQYEDVIEHEYDNTYSYNDEEYIVLTDKEADELAVEYMKDLLDDIGIEGTNLNQEDYINNTDWFDTAMQESYESYVKEIENESDNTYDNRLIAELVETGLLDDDDFETDEDGDIDYYNLNDDVNLDDKREKYIEVLMDNYSDSVEWFKSNFGDDEFNDILKDKDLIDIDRVVDDIIRIDGRGSVISSYDGAENKLNNFYIYRTS